MGTQPLRRKAPRRRWLSSPTLPLHVRKYDRSSFITLEDNSSISLSAVDLFNLRGKRDPFGEAAKLAEQIKKQNRSVLSFAQLEYSTGFNGRDIAIRLQAGNTIGAIPLLSPTTGKPDYGVIIQPRFPWSGIGPMLGEMGWRIAPTPLKFETFKGSERSIPSWVLSSMILARIEALLRSLDRRFEIVTETLSAPRGTVRWTKYATSSLPSALFLSVPCTFPVLGQDHQLLGTIRYCLERLFEDLRSQVEHGSFVQRIIELTEELLFLVRNVPTYRPTAAQMAAWLHKPVRTEFLLEGIEALQWITEKRGLAGSSTLAGIPWVLEMERFFEAWVETVFHSVARATGAIAKVGRLKQTTRDISWNPPYLGSQKSLVPDLWLQWGSITLIVDAKYKRHFEELQAHNWNAIESEWKEQHRNDLMQVLAYANLAETPTLIACLVYPCTPDTWVRLSDAHKLIHKAQINVGSKTLHLWLTAVPMGLAAGRIASTLTHAILRAFQSTA